MAKTPIFPRTNRGEAGITLVELLVALAVMSLAAGMVFSAGARLLPGIELRQACDTLITDLKRARLEASLSGEPVVVAPTGDGYRIEAIGIERVLPSGTRIDWPAETARIQFMPDWGSTGGKIRIVKGKRVASIFVDPLLGQVRREE